MEAPRFRNELPKAPADDGERRAVVFERVRNVVVDAGAGTGKTTLVVQRLVEMVAPSDDRFEAVPLSRIAAVTFTRKAAGELRLRVREEILRGLADPALSETRRHRLHDAIGALDDAHIGTIHSFADRLLRMHPVEARLSPSYEIVEDAGALHAETFGLLMTSLDRGTLRGELAGTKAADLAQEATDIIHAAVTGGLQTDTRETPHYIKFGLDAFVAGLLEHRDVPPQSAGATTFDRKTFVRYVDEFLVLAGTVHGKARGSRWFARAASTLREVRDEPDVARVYKRVITVVDQGGASFTKGVDFEDDPNGYDAWKAFDGDTRKKRIREVPLRDDLMCPLFGWMARRLARLAPVLEALYEKVKARRRVVDTIDLLLRLRDLLADHLTVRQELQSLFDHIFVDEFQDTDPLQAEAMLFLAEGGARARDAWKTKLASNKLTIVGDPKQSIYRFRRADVATYDRVRRKLAETAPLEATLSVNFRSTPGLVAWFNDRFARVLGERGKGVRFDPATGEVFHAALEAAKDPVPEAAASVEVIPMAPVAEGVDAVRGCEANALARYVRWLVEESATEVSDPLTGERRAIRYGDVAVLAVITTNLPLLCRAFDLRRVPYTTSGGTLFASDGLHRQFLLGLRALADREDGVAQAALLRPPFFAIDLADLARALGQDAEGDARVVRVREAQTLIAALRRDRATRSPGGTARDLLERSALGRVVALGPNGAQRLRHLRELCVELDTLAAADGLDYDACTYVMRQWVDAPPALDPPRPVDDAAVRISTVHQAKGLEFPVVILWDSRCEWDTRPFTPPWAIDRETRSWAIKIEPRLNWDEPPAVAFAEREKKYRDAERRRLVYVAATRAREKFVVATATGGRSSYVNTQLAEAAPPAVEKCVRHWPVFHEDQADAWPGRPGRTRPQGRNVPVEDATAADERITAAWGLAMAEAERPRFQRIAASSLGKLAKGQSAAEEPEEDDDLEPPRQTKVREGRFGPVFGDTVHRALALVLERNLSARDAVARAAREKGLDEHLGDAVGDVERTLHSLAGEGLLGATRRLEYPVALDELGEDGRGWMVTGSIDLLLVDGERLHVIDFKTDRAPAEGSRVEETHGAYVAQVNGYARMLMGTGVSATKKVRCGLLFTETGRVWWVPGPGA
jgi:ATP-dependent helicase/nuclease subunit A